MNRRQFTLSLAAISGAAALPTAAPVAAQYSSAQLQRAILLARAHNKSSVAMLQRLIKVDAQTAKALQTALIKTKVIGAPNAFGVREALKPFMKAAVPQNISVSQTSLKIGKTVRKLADRVIEENDAPPPFQSDDKAPT